MYPQARLHSGCAPVGRVETHDPMPQIFHRSANTLSKVSLFAVLSLAVGGILLAMVIGRSSYVTRAHEFIEQPIQFSHLHHVLDDGIDCRYCHTSVETSSFAGIPPTKTCINCHSQLFATEPILEPVRASFRDETPLSWTRVHDLPDFVYFNHSIHVQKGIGCTSCHGRVDMMNLTWQEESLQMEWCLSCHRHPEDRIRPRAEVFNMQWTAPANQRELGLQLIKEYDVRTEQLTNCSICHR
jgi:hypothetical protein